MKKSRVSNTAQVNLLMLADLGIEEAVTFQSVLGFSPGILGVFSHIPMADLLPQCIALISEVLYERTNQLIQEHDNPLILDLACGYSPRVLRFCDPDHIYIGVDLPDVAEHLRHHIHHLVGAKAFAHNHYFSADLTKYEELDELISSMNSPETIITQALLTYLTLDQKQMLMDQLKVLLKRSGGCWIIPDAEPDRMLPEVFEAVLGSGALSIYEQVISILDRIVKRDRTANGWQSLDEITEALELNGFTVTKVPLYTDSLQLRSLERLSTECAEQIKDNWRNTSSLVVEVK